MWEAPPTLGDMMPDTVERGRFASGRAEIFVVVALLVIAAAVRLPYLWEIPRFTDETAEAEFGLRIARGEILPLTNVDPYIGALWSYLLAAPSRSPAPACSPHDS